MSIYIIDTSSWIDFSRRYPKNIFPDLWNNVEELIRDHKIKIPRAVYDEINESYDDNPLINLIEEYKQTIVKKHADDIEEFAQQIISDHPNFINIAEHKN